MKPEPYARDNDRSKRAKMSRPKDLVNWFLLGFRQELPTDIHSREVWRDYVPDQHLSSGGGSLLGTPRWSDPFRRFIEDDPFGTEAAEYEGHKSIGNHYRTPMRAALARLAGRGGNGRGFLLARSLYIFAATDGDISRSMGGLHAFTRNDAGEVVPDPDAEMEYRRIVIEKALHQLYDRFHEEPPVYVRESAA